MEYPPSTEEWDRIEHARAVGAEWASDDLLDRCDRMIIALFATRVAMDPEIAESSGSTLWIDSRYDACLRTALMRAGLKPRWWGDILLEPGQDPIARAFMTGAVMATGIEPWHNEPAA